jgi:DNA-nicking Smr family endonuclease
MLGFFATALIIGLFTFFIEVINDAITGEDESTEENNNPDTHQRVVQSEDLILDTVPPSPREKNLSRVLRDTSDYSDLDKEVINKIDQVGVYFYDSTDEWGESDKLLDVSNTVKPSDILTEEEIMQIHENVDKLSYFSVEASVADVSMVRYQKDTKSLETVKKKDSCNIYLTDKNQNFYDQSRFDPIDGNEVKSYPPRMFDSDSQLPSLAENIKIEKNNSYQISMYLNHENDIFSSLSGGIYVKDISEKVESVGIRDDKERMRSCRSSMKKLGRRLDKARSYEKGRKSIKIKEKTRSRYEPVFSLDLHGFRESNAKSAIRSFLNLTEKYHVEEYSIIYGKSRGKMYDLTKDYLSNVESRAIFDDAQAFVSRSAKEIKFIRHKIHVPITHRIYRFYIRAKLDYPEINNSYDKLRMFSFRKKSFLD